MSDLVEIERDLHQARENLNHTLDEVNRKASATAHELSPEEPIRRHPIPSLCAAMALGLAAGGWRMPAMALGTLAACGVLLTHWPGEPASESRNGTA